MKIRVDWGLAEESVEILICRKRKEYKPVGGIYLLKREIFRVTQYSFSNHIYLLTGQFFFGKKLL